MLHTHVSLPPPPVGCVETSSDLSLKRLRKWMRLCNTSPIKVPDQHSPIVLCMCVSMTVATYVQCCVGIRAPQDFPLPHIPVGTILHYSDTSLQSVYFLDPQWLTKVMAAVIGPPKKEEDGKLIQDGEFYLALCGEYWEY